MPCPAIAGGYAATVGACHHARMEIHFLGGATTVTGSQFLLVTARARVLIDCGMFQGSPNESIRNRIPFDFEPSELDAVLLTHAHLDHCGLLPVLGREGYAGPIHATAGTVELATVVLLDSGHLHEEFAKRDARWEKRHPELVAADDRKHDDAYQAALDLAEDGEDGVIGGPIEAGEHVPTTIEPIPSPRRPTLAARSRGGPRAQPPHLDIDLDAPLYTVKDAEAVLPQFSPVDYGEELEVAPGVHATFVDAGHILGSAIIRVRVTEQEGGEERVIVFSGDVGRPGTPILRDPTVMTGADYVLVESTYGGREHEPEAEAIRILAETIRMVAEADGVLLVPSFAIGRTQEVVWELDRLITRGEIPLLPLYLDSPMAQKASDIYRHHPDYYDEETAKLLREGESPLDYPNQIIVRDYKASQAIARAPRPYMIVASNGMLTGGRVVGHLRNLIDDPTRHDPVRRLPGRGHAGGAPPGRRRDREARRPGPPGALPGPLDQRLLGPRRRERAARLAARVRGRPPAGRPRLSAQGLPRPRRSRGPGRARAQGARPGLRHARPALARASHPGLT